MIKQQDYTGMDNMTLIRHESIIKDYRETCEFNIAQAKQQIANYKRVINENENNIKVANNELLKINEAMKSAGDASYEHVIMVKRVVEHLYKGSKSKGYYDAKDWKESVKYTFEVRKVNVLGAEKGMHTVWKSLAFGSNVKAALNDEIVTMAQQFGVKKIYLDDGVKVNSAKLKAAIPDLVIR